jgi:hypothetical protein
MIQHFPGRGACGKGPSPGSGTARRPARQGRAGKAREGKGRQGEGAFDGPRDTPKNLRWGKLIGYRKRYPVALSPFSAKPADGQQSLDPSRAERKAKVQPDRLGADVSRKAVASIAGVSNVLHRTGRPRNALHPVNLTVPATRAPLHGPVLSPPSTGGVLAPVTAVSPVRWAISATKSKSGNAKLKKY